MKLAVAVIALIAPFLGGCAAPEPVRGAALDSLAFDLMLYAARESRLPPAHSPRIAFVEDVRAIAADRRNPLAEHADALYDNSEQTIYLPSGWNGHGVADRALLLHEVVHHLQRNVVSVDAFVAHYRRRFPDQPLCLRTLEREACGVELGYYFAERRQLPPSGRTIPGICAELTAIYPCEPVAE